MPKESYFPGMEKWSSQQQWSGARQLAEQTLEGFAEHGHIPRGFPEMLGEGAALVQDWTSCSQVIWKNPIWALSELELEHAGLQEKN